MPIKFGNSDVTTFRLGNSQVDRIYWGDHLVWTSRVPLTASVSGGTAQVFQPEPAPAQMTVEAQATVTPSGGTGSYTISWARISGDAITIGTVNARTARFTANLFHNSQRTAMVRCTISDGITTITRDFQVTLYYYTNL